MLLFWWFHNWAPKKLNSHWNPCNSKSFKPFGVLASTEIFVSARRLFTETMMSINAKMANWRKLTRKIIQIRPQKKVLPHCGLWPLSFLASVFYFIWRIFLLAQLASLGKTLIINSCVIVPQPYLSVSTAHYNLYIHGTTQGPSLMNL